MPTVKRLALALLLLVNVAAVAFIAGRQSVPPPETELRWSESGRWIEVYHRGELVAEYQAADGVTFRELAWALTCRNRNHQAHAERYRPVGAERTMPVRILNRQGALLLEYLGDSLAGADLSKAKLVEADLSSADLRGADLRGADLSRADLSRADLSRANLFGAYLFGAYLGKANLRGADLRRVYLNGTYLTVVQRLVSFPGCMIPRLAIAVALLNPWTLHGVAEWFRWLGSKF